MIQIDFASLKLTDIEKVIFGDVVEISDVSRRRVEDSFDFLKDFSKNKIIYGINTGFGPMAQYKIEEKEQKELQYNLIRSHASGSGVPLDDIYVRASMLARLNTLSLGFSGVNPTALDVLTQLINHNVTPLIFEHGGVGASGDLVQLAHLALVMIGEGQVKYKGETVATRDVFQSLGIKP